MTRKVAVAQIQIARTNKPYELDQHISFTIRWCKQATFNDHFWQDATLSLSHPFLGYMRGGIDESHAVLTSQRRGSHVNETIDLPCSF